MTRARDARAPRAWTAAHKRAREHDEHDDWRRRRRHVLAFTSAGKPAWTRYGSTHGVSGLCATLQALGAVSASAMGGELEGAEVAGRRLARRTSGAMTYATSSDRGESAATLEKHLEWVERGVKMLVTNAGLETALAKNAKFDVGRALATATRADEVLGQLARNLSWETCYVFDTYTAVRVRAEVRETVARAMVEAMKTVTKPFACVAFGDDGRVGAYAKPRGHRPTTIAASDLIVLMNFLRVVSRCEGDEDSFTRVCLPEFNPDGFMRAYTARLRARDGDAAGDEGQPVKSTRASSGSIGICIITASADAMEECRAARDALEKRLNDDGALAQMVAAAGESMSIAKLPSEALGGFQDASEPLLHFVYNRPARHQHVSSAFSPSLNGADVKAITRAYASTYTSMKETEGVVDASGPGPKFIGAAQRVRYERRARFSVLACVGGDFEIYLTLKPSTTTTTAVALCNRLCVWLRVHEPELFVEE